jgi:hypothetical protein
MSFKIHFADQGFGLVFKRSVSSSSSKDISDALAVFLNDNKEALLAIRYLYIDYSESGKLTVSMEDILRFVEIAKTVALENKSLVVAICAPQFENYCITKMWDVHLPDDTGWITMAFRDGDKAKAWLQQTVQEELTFL